MPLRSAAPRSWRNLAGRTADEKILINCRHIAVLASAQKEAAFFRTYGFFRS